MNAFFAQLCSHFIFNKRKRRAFKKKHLLPPLHKQIGTLQTAFNSSVAPASLPPARGLNRVVQLLTLDILKDIDRVCKKHDIPYWLEFGTLLGAIRHKGFIPWDDDLDICMTYRDLLRFQEVAASELESSTFKLMPGSIGKVVHNDFCPENEAEWCSTYRVGDHKKLFAFVDIFPVHYLKEEHDTEEAARCIRETCATLIRTYKEEENKHGRNWKTWQKVQDTFTPTEAELASATATSRIYTSLLYPWQDSHPTKALIWRTKDIFPLTECEFEGLRLPAPHNAELHLWFIYGEWWKTVIYDAHLNFKTLDDDCLEKLFQKGRAYQCL